jgi:hypothetical protein
MSRKLWLLVMLMLGAVALLAVVLSQVSLSSLSGGARAAQVLQDRLRVTCRDVVLEVPPLRVFAIPPQKEGAGWRWKVAGTLRPGKACGSPEVESAVERVVARALTLSIQENPPAGIVVLLHRAGSPDMTRSWDSLGRPSGPWAEPAPPPVPK